MNQRQLDLPGLLAGADDADDGGAQAHMHDRGELHVHMNGAIPLSTIQEIMTNEATPIPAGFDLKRDMIRLAPYELRSSVLYLTGLQNCTPAQALERLIESTGSAAQHHCIQRGLILTVTRGDYGASNLATLLQAYGDLGRPKDVVGLDLAGDEEMPYSAKLPVVIR